MRPLSTMANTKDFEKAPIATGPFVMASYESNKKAVMKKNPKYWGGEVKSDGVEYTKVTDANALAMSLQGGEVDIAQDLTVERCRDCREKKTTLL